MAQGRCRRSLPFATRYRQDRCTGHFLRGPPATTTRVRCTTPPAEIAPAPVGVTATHKIYLNCVAGPSPGRFHAHDIAGRLIFPGDLGMVRNRYAETWFKPPGDRSLSERKTGVESPPGDRQNECAGWLTGQNSSSMPYPHLCRTSAPRWCPSSGQISPLFSRKRAAITGDIGA